MGSLKKRGRIWHGSYTGPEGRVRVSLETDSKGIARRRLAELEDEAWRQRHGLSAGPLPRMTCRELWDAYWKTEGSAKGSGRNDEIRWRVHIEPALGGVQASSVTPAQVKQLLTDMRTTEGYKPSTCEQTRKFGRLLWNFGIHRLKRLRENPWAGRDMRVRVPKKQPVWLTLHQLALLFHAVPERYKGIFAVAIYTGLRKGEIMGLLKSDVDLAKMQIAVSRSWDRDTTKDSEERAVPIQPALLPWIRRALAVRTSLYLFPDGAGGLYRNAPVSKVMRRALIRAGLTSGFEFRCARACGYREKRAEDTRVACPTCGRALRALPAPLVRVSFRSLRSTFAHHLANSAEAGIQFAQELLGHESLDQTARDYARTSEEGRRRAVAVIRLPRNPRPGK